MTPTGPHTAREPGYRLRWSALFVILAAEVMDLLDALITSIAGPHIVRDLGGTETLIQWLAAGYTLAMAGGLLIGGRLGDIAGRRRMFLVGMAGFTAFSLACALAPTPEVLLGGRVLQGLFGAVMLPQGLGMIKEMFPPAEIGKAFGAFGPIMGLSAVAGPIVAGLLIDADLFGWGWRTIFAINVPLGLAAIAVGRAVLPASSPDRTLRLPLAGVLIATGSMVALVYPLIQGRELGWPAWCFALVAAGLAGFGLLVRVEIGRERAGRPTLVTPSLFAKPAFTGGLVVGLALFGSMFGVGLVFTLFTQLGLGYSPTWAGLAGIAQAIGMVVGFIVGQPLNERLGRRLMHLGQLVAVAGVLGFIGTLSFAGDAIGIPVMSPSLAVVGFGMGLSMGPFFDIALAGVDERESGSASGVLTAVQQLAGALGVAVLGTLFFHVLAVGGAGTRIGTFRDAAGAAYWLAVGLLLVAGGLTFLLPRHARPDAAVHAG